MFKANSNFYHVLKFLPQEIYWSLHLWEAILFNQINFDSFFYLNNEYLIPKINYVYILIIFKNFKNLLKKNKDILITNYIFYFSYFLFLIISLILHLYFFL